MLEPRFSKYAATKSETHPEFTIHLLSKQVEHFENIDFYGTIKCHQSETKKKLPEEIRPKFFKV